MTSAPGEPPGSRVTRTRSFATSRRSANFLIWVDFPDPSPPSKEMRRPRPGVRLTAASGISEPLDAGAEHADHQFAHAIDGAAHGRSGADRLRGINRRLH